MATRVRFEEIWDFGDGDKTYIFRASNRELLEVKSFENGIAIVDPLCGSDIHDFAKLISGCFHKGSNVEKQLKNFFGCDSKTTLNGIQFEFNEVTVLVTKENANARKIVAEWRAGVDANAERYRLEMEAYMKTPEYHAERAKLLKKEARIVAVKKEVLTIDNSTELEFKDDEAKKTWGKIVEVNSDNFYNRNIVTYARRWGKYMQHLMAKHNKTVSQIAEQASRVCDIDGITGFMYGCAVAMLSECWKYGEDLRKWHNKQYGQYDCEGVINPALLTITVG